MQHGAPRPEWRRRKLRYEPVLLGNVINDLSRQSLRNSYLPVVGHLLAYLPVTSIITSFRRMNGSVQGAL